MDKYFKLLYAYQGDCELAYLKDNSISEDDYKALSQSPEYNAYLQSIKERFEKHLDTLLISEQAQAHQDLQDIRAGKIDYRHLKAISDHWLSTLKITSPILERMNVANKQSEELSNLKLVIIPALTNANKED